MMSRIFNSLSEATSRTANRTSKLWEPSDSKTSSSINDFKQRAMSTENRSRRASAPEIVPSNNLRVTAVTNTTTNVKRRSSIFGISSVSCDDYVQKDLTTSSWC